MTFAAALSDGRTQVGMWVSSASPYCAEICAGSGLDWLLIDAEHSPNDLSSILAQLQAVAAYPVHPVVRPPVADPVVLKQFLDIGVQNLLVPMIDSQAAARRLVEATRYPPRGMRGVGSALARASRWNRIPGYLAAAEEDISLIVQIESGAALDDLEAIATEDGIDAVFIGPADLAASLGHLGEPDHPEVVRRIDDAIERVGRLHKPVGINAFDEARARRCIALGCRFVLVGADVTLLARGSEALAARFARPPSAG
jgi:4-hydroxy-2-oxoheptanedioate aldolase